jgi:hypothetical protein
MPNLVSKVVYFENTGEANSDETLRLAKERADELGVSYMSSRLTSHPSELVNLASDLFESRSVNIRLVRRPPANYCVPR